MTPQSPRSSRRVRGALLQSPDRLIQCGHGLGISVFIRQNAAVVNVTIDSSDTLSFWAGPYTSPVAL
ncbi:MAG TPA: hypothetical protein VMR62_30675 [Bryobacteraceae bacterium]|jgi:hypothetical protein|nr:hypothetical protein [Bryobacteraceae bacterium]